jgi:hypothetical protein
MYNQPPPRPAPASGGVILMLGILSILILPLLGPFAWIFGNQALAAIKAGTMNTAEGGSASAGRICGIVGTVILTVAVVGTVVYMAIVMVFGRQMVGTIQNLSSNTSTPIKAPQPLFAPGSTVPTKTVETDDPFAAAIMTGDTVKAKSLIAATPSLVNKKGSTGQTPLFDAAFFGKASIAKLLIDNGADVNAKDEFGKTPLDNAVFFHHPDVAALIKQHGGHAGKGM